MTTSTLPMVLERMSRCRVMIVGDLCLDRYSWGDADRISPEAPVLVFCVNDYEHRLGGAASVAHLARGIGAEVFLSGVVGADAEGRLISTLLLDSGVQHNALRIDPARPTTLKERFVGKAGHRRAHQILRVDRERRDFLDRDVEARLISATLSQMKVCEALLVSDYGKGVCTPRLMKAVIQAARELAIPVVVDPARDANYELYRGATVITPNRLEAGVAVGRSIKTIADAFSTGTELCERFDIPNTLITLDCDGLAITTLDRQAGHRCEAVSAIQPHDSLEQMKSSQHFPTRRREVNDVTGAGDMVLAIMGLGLAAKQSIVDSILLANVAAGLEVERQGVSQVTPNEILADLVRHHGSSSTSETSTRESVTDRETVSLHRCAIERILN